MKNTLVLLLLALALVGLALFALVETEDDPGVAEAADTQTVESADTPDVLESSPDTSTERVPETEAAKDEIEAELAAQREETMRPPDQLVRGRVLDVRGNPVIGVDIMRHQEKFDEFGTPQPVAPALATTAGDGSFEFTTGEHWFTIFTRSDDWVAVCHARVDLPQKPQPGSETPELLLVVAPRIEISGLVYNTTGAPIPNSLVSITMSMGALTDFPFPLDKSIPHGDWWAGVNESGQFKFESAPGGLTGARIKASSKGFEGSSGAAPLVTTRNLVITLESNSSEEPKEEKEPESVIRGMVVGPGGAGVDDALVVFGASTARSTADGSFEVVPEGWLSDSEALIATKSGHRHALHADFGKELKANPNPAAVVLQLGGAPLTIAGRVLGADGAAQIGWKVRLLDPTYIEQSGETEHAEAYAAAEPDQLITDAEGRFWVGGLADRTYSLRAWSDTTYASVESEAVMAGTQNLVLTVPADALLKTVTGRVVSLAGAPVEGAEVGVTFTYEQTPSSTGSVEAANEKTDSEGRFELKNVPSRRVSVTVAGDNIIALREPYMDDLPSSGLVLVVERRCHFRVEWVGNGPAPSFVTAHDDAGEYTYISTRTARRGRSSTRLTLKDGQSAVVSTTERTVSLGYRLPDQDSQRVDVTFIPGEVTVVQLDGR